MCTAQHSIRMRHWILIESNLAKQQASATFGKTLKQLRDRVNRPLIADSKKVMKAVSKPSFCHSEIVNDDLVMVRGSDRKSS